MQVITFLKSNKSQEKSHQSKTDTLFLILLLSKYKTVNYFMRAKNELYRLREIVLLRFTFTFILKIVNTFLKQLKTFLKYL